MSRCMHNDPRVRTALTRIRQEGILRPSGEILDAVEDPHWDSPFLAHDWRRHVPPALRDTWDTLPLDTRLCVYESAEFSAIDEDSDSVMVTEPGLGER